MKRYMSFFVNAILVLATFIVSYFIVLALAEDMGDFLPIVAIALTVLIIFVYRKIAKKYNL